MGFGRSIRGGLDTTIYIYIILYTIIYIHTAKPLYPPTDPAKFCPALNSHRCPFRLIWFQKSRALVYLVKQNQTPGPSIFQKQGTYANRTCPLHALQQASLPLPPARGTWRGSRANPSARRGWAWASTTSAGRQGILATRLFLFLGNPDLVGWKGNQQNALAFVRMGLSQSQSEKVVGVWFHFNVTPLGNPLSVMAMA